MKGGFPPGMSGPSDSEADFERGGSEARGWGWSRKGVRQTRTMVDEDVLK